MRYLFYCYCCVSDRWQAQNADKRLVGDKAAYGTEQLTDHKDRWSVCASSLSSSNTWPSCRNITATGSLPYQQPSGGMWTDTIESGRKNDVAGVVLPWTWWNHNDDKWITPSEKQLCEAISSLDQQHLMTNVKVRMITFIIEIVYT